MEMVKFSKIPEKQSMLRALSAVYVRFVFVVCLLCFFLKSKRNVADHFKGI